jgi:hypothetical protein
MYSESTFLLLALNSKTKNEGGKRWFKRKKAELKTKKNNNSFLTTWLLRLMFCEYICSNNKPTKR